MKFLLDSGDPQEYKEIATLAQGKGSELWGATTNPSLIAKKLMSGDPTKKISKDEAFALQKQIVLEILDIVPGAVSAEVYADEQTTAEEMIAQGKDIANWHKRVVVKLPTTIESFKARTELRKAKIMTNNTLVFSQEQIFAICLHEQIMQQQYGPITDAFPPLISPFVGRLDDIGINGMDLVKNGMKVKSQLSATLWMLEASVRTITHISQGKEMGAESLTAPSKIFRAYFTGQDLTTIPPSTLTSIPLWEPAEELVQITSIEAFMNSLTTGQLSTQHDLTDKGLKQFAQDWNALISS